MEWPLMEWPLMEWRLMEWPFGPIAFPEPL
jgi:hypothetical protein